MLTLPLGILHATFHIALVVHGLPDPCLLICTHVCIITFISASLPTCHVGQAQSMQTSLPMYAKLSLSRVAFVLDQDNVRASSYI